VHRSGVAGDVLRGALWGLIARDVGGDVGLRNQNVGITRIAIYFAPFLKVWNNMRLQSE
jgi:hypothetical protein